jgi:hypothetical protein
VPPQIKLPKKSMDLKPLREVSRSTLSYQFEAGFGDEVGAFLPVQIHL